MWQYQCITVNGPMSWVKAVPTFAMGTIRFQALAVWKFSFGKCPFMARENRLVLVAEGAVVKVAMVIFLVFPMRLAGSLC